MPQNLNMSQDALTIFFDLRVNHSSHTNSEDSSMADSQEDIKRLLEKLFSEGESLYANETKLMTGRELLNFISPKVNQGEVIIPTSRKMVFCYYMYLEQLSDEWIDQFFEAEEEYWYSNQAANYSDYQYVIALGFRANTIQEGQRSKYTQLLRLLAGEKNHNGILNRQVFLLRISGFDDYSNQEHALIQRLYLMSRKTTVLSGEAAASGIHMLNYMDYYENRASECFDGIAKIRKWIEIPVDPGLQEFSEQLNALANSVSNQLEDIRRRFSVRSRIYPVRIDQFKGNWLTGYKLAGSQNNPRLRKRKNEFIEKEKERILEQTDFSSVRKLIDDEYHYPDRKELARKFQDGTLKEIVVGGEKPEQGESSYSENTIKEEIYIKIKDLVEKETENSEKMLASKRAEMRSLQKLRTEAGRYSSIEDCFNNIAKDIIPMEAHWKQLVGKQLVALISGSPAQNWEINNYAINDIPTVYCYPKINPCEVAVLLEYDMVPLDDSMEATMGMLY